MDENLSKASFWDGRYGTSTGEAPTHEWFKSFDSLKAFFQEHLLGPIPPEKHPSILHLGCGDSTVPLDLHSLGYKSQTCIDFSQVVITRMSKRHNSAGLAWLVGDVRDMRAQIRDYSVDVAFDKGTLDAMIRGSPWDPPEDVREDVKAYLDEVVRVLKPGGVFLYITFRQPHFQKPLLARSGVWSLEVEELADEGGGGGFGYFGFVMTKVLS